MPESWPLLICIAVLPLMAQQDPEIGVSADLVQVDAVVTGSQGSAGGKSEPGRLPDIRGW